MLPLAKSNPVILPESIFEQLRGVQFIYYGNFKPGHAPAGAWLLSVSALPPKLREIRLSASLMLRLLHFV